MGEEEICRSAYLWAENADIEDERTGLPSPFRPNRSKISDLLHAAYSLSAIDSEIEMPGLLGPLDIDPAEAMAVENGIVDLRTRRLIPASPLFFSPTCADFPFRHQPAAPQRWLQFLHEIWPQDKEAVSTLQELFGYMLTSDTSAQKLFMLVGPKRSGKGTIARVLGALVGRDAMASPTLSGMSTAFGLAPLIGKRFALVSDVRLSGRSDLSVIAERLLAISGEDTLTVDRKHLVSWTGKLNTRFLLLSNELPALRDASGALASRFVILTMTRSFFGEEDPHLFETLRSELPAIFWWALDGLDRLRKRGRFLEPQSSNDERNELDRLTSPTKAFIEDEIVVDPRARIAIAEAYAAWRVWCGNTGQKEGTLQTFGRNMKSALPGLAIERDQFRGDRTRYYLGIRLR